MTLPNFIPTIDGKSEVFVFFSTTSTQDTGYRIFARPRSKAMCSILLLGPGNAGGAGFSRASGADGGGGGGGGSGGLTRLILPARYLPETLFVHVPCGGFASSTLVLAAPDGSTENRIGIAGRGSIGGAGTGSAGGAGGAAGAAQTVAGCGPWTSLGQFVSIAGTAGAAGGAHTGATGGTATWGLGNIPFSGGGGGGGSTGTDFAGGQISNFLSKNPLDILGGVANGGAGNGGFMVPVGMNDQPALFTGGSGGGTDDDATGGRGGDGTYGCGGGGGGAGVTGGTGGRGGDGLVVMVFW